MTVHRYLVTGCPRDRMMMWAATAEFANWIEGRKRGDQETWNVTCLDEDSDAFLDRAAIAGVTVEEIDGAGESETYRMVVGEPGSGWRGWQPPAPVEQGAIEWHW